MCHNPLNYLKIARFDHWVKQLFVLPGTWIAFVMVSPIPSMDLVVRLVLGMIATSSAASANYCINEWLDMEFDKFHPVKKHRPFVTNKLSVPIVLAEYVFFVMVSLIIANFISTTVLIAEALLLAMGIFYNVKPIRTKDLPYVDVLTESMNNAIRLIIGWFCVTNLYLPPTSIVFGYWMGGAFLMAAKRFAEYRMIGDPEQAKLYRKSFWGYSEKRLLTSAIFYGYLSVFFCGIFLVKYRIELILVLPFICLLFCYYLSICFKPDSAAQKPEKLFHEKLLMLLCALTIVGFIVCYYIRIPALDFLLLTDLIPIKGK
ncbi:MAG: UbiA prenyltransferase family protein [Fibromonadaceae bacterium]|jgi:4-hydroxybenzoate polyprenyltransferase|nr:UbiA prenyltransferase family protein [Fibromonadaceae bacterium]